MEQWKIECLQKRKEKHEKRSKIVFISPFVITGPLLVIDKPFGPVDKKTRLHSWIGVYIITFQESYGIQKTLRICGLIPPAMMSCTRGMVSFENS